MTNTTPVSDSPAPIRKELVLAGGIVAHNEEHTLAPAVRSLLDQKLPEGIRWGIVWIVASGCTDGTVEVAQRLAREDPRIHVHVEPDRRGKAHAICEVLRRAEGDVLVLLNGDARSEPEALGALLHAAEGVEAPFAVMGHPVPPEGSSSLMDRVVRLLWTVHHELNGELDTPESGAHLSDELLLLSLPPVPALHEGIINDGAFLGVWLNQHHGRVVYAPDALVRIQVPTSLRDHLRQRRRILVGHRQIAIELGVGPRTLTDLAAAEPGRALRLLVRGLREGGHTLTDLVALCSVETVALALAAWDALPPRKNHVRWTRISPPETAPSESPEEGPQSPRREPSALACAPIDLRLRSLLEVARRYRTGIPIDQLTSLLPEDGPARPAELQEWLAGRPGIARVEGDRVFPVGAIPPGLAERAARGLRYRSAATELVEDHLGPVLPWVRCLGITGSTAYGEPEAGDDLDFFVVTRPGSTWVFLTYTYLAVRLRFRPDGLDRRPLPCFNYVLDEPAAAGEFARPRGFLFAREALTARVLHGEDYYGALLAAAPWLGDEIPRLYAQRRSTSAPRAAPAPAPWGIRLLNAALFVPLASYLHLAGLRRNAGFRRERADSGAFRTRTELGRLAFASVHFERLRTDLTLPPPAPVTTDRSPNAPFGPARIPEFLHALSLVSPPAHQPQGPTGPLRPSGRPRDYGASGGLAMGTDTLSPPPDGAANLGGQ
jgi:hypothetical protein